MSDSLGRLVRTTNEKCQECHSPLQIRARNVQQLSDGETLIFEQEYKYCPKCQEEYSLEKYPKNDWRRLNDRHKKSAIAFERNERESRKGYRGGGKRSSKGF